MTGLFTQDLLWQSAAERTEELASSATLCRLENRAGRKEAWLMREVLFEKFVNNFQSAPKELILDFHCTDDRVHGPQEGRHFHGFYCDFCFLPLYVFCGERLLISYLRESNIDPAKHDWAILAFVSQGATQTLAKRQRSSCGPTAGGCLAAGLHLAFASYLGGLLTTRACLCLRVPGQRPKRFCNASAAGGLFLRQLMSEGCFF
jgi:hypothetical protein